MVDTPGEVKSLEILASTVPEPQDDITIAPSRIEDSPPGLDEEQGVPVAEPSGEILATEPPAIDDNEDAHDIDDIPQEAILEQASLPESADNSFSVALETLTSVTGSVLDESKEIITTDQEDVLSENPSNSKFNEATAASADVPEGLSSREVALEVIIDSDDNKEKEATPTDQEDTSTETASLSEINEPMASVDLLEAPSNGQATPSTLLSEVIPVSEPIIAYESKEKDLEIVSADSNPTLDSQDVPSTARDVVLESTEDALTPPSEPVERPRSPWTPSYSVTTQGPGIPLPQDILSEVSNALAPEVPPESNPPSRPWTPSYSVVVQGSPSVASANLETHVTSSELPIEALTVAETLENDRILPVTLADAPPELPVDLLAREELVDIAPSFTQLTSDASEPVIAELAEAGQPLEESQAPSSDAVPVSNAIEPELLPSGESARISLDSTPQGGLFSGSNDGIEPSASAPSYSATTQDPEQVEEAPSAQPTLTFSDVPHDTRTLEDVPRPISPRAPSYSVVLEGSQVAPPIESEEPGPAIVDPSTLRDPDVESQTCSPDLASDAVVAALVESGVIAEEPELLAQDTKVYQGDVVEESAPVGAEATIEPVERPVISPEIQDVIVALETPREEQTVKAPDDAVAPQPKSVGSTNQHTPLASAKSLPEPQPFPLSVDVPEDANDEDDFVPPLSPRTRLESTASSLFFPGGWFSKLPEGRPSLEVAAGEFTSPKPASPSLPSKPTSPSVPSPPAEEVVVEAVDRDEKKGKWCVVM
ncbi:hypothetical protein C8F01DRAFT_1119511 [Mycena amicta]|nr:hypothetical protein C8F01DRAFT_1119511 [Mycena amicta]